MFKLAIFDLDGTLFDTVGDIYTSLVYVFTNRGIAVPSRAQVQAFMGDGLAVFLNKAASLSGAEATLQLTEDFLSYYYENCTAQTKPYKGIGKLLPKLSELGVTLAVVSNKAYVLVSKILNHFEFTGYFSMVSGGDTFREKKPSPLPLKETLRDLGFSSEDAVMIGDSENDVASGTAAGVKTCYCSYGYGKNLATLPNFIVETPSGISKLFLENI